MHHLTRRGFTLVELVVALVLLGIVSAGIYKILISNQRLYQAQTQRIDLQQNLRAAGAIFPGELRELDAVDGDIEALGADSIRIRAMRALGFLCDPPVMGGSLGGLQMTMRKALRYGRALNYQTDSLLIFYEGDPTTRNDDGWVLAQLVQSPNDATCSDGSPGRHVVATLLPTVNQVNAAGVITPGAPVHGFQVVTYKAYQSSDSKWYIGLEDANGTQPVIGPITGPDGLTLTYYDSSGAVTAVPTRVARIAVTVRAETAQPVQQSGVGGGLITKVDSVTTQITLRNNPRF